MTAPKSSKRQIIAVGDDGRLVLNGIADMDSVAVGADENGHPTYTFTACVFVNSPYDGPCFKYPEPLR